METANTEKHRDVTAVKERPWILGTEMIGIVINLDGKVS